jgi:hypothetical protein
VAAVVLLAALSACGVKAPPRASGASEQAPPNDLFKPPPVEQDQAPAPAGELAR